MPKQLLALALLSFSTVAGCAASTESPADDGTPTGEDELKSAECPKSVEVMVQKPSIASDASLKSSWARDMAAYESNPSAAAQEQLTLLSSHVAKARAEGAVKLRGTLGKACFYATVDAQSGQPNGYHLWFAKSGGRNGQLQLRITRDLGTPDDTLFFNAPLESLSPTSVEVDTAKDARVYAQHHETGYHGEPEGPNAWIGSAKITATLAH